MDDDARPAGRDAEVCEYSIDEHREALDTEELPAEDEPDGADHRELAVVPREEVPR